MAGINNQHVELHKLIVYVFIQIDNPIDHVVHVGRGYRQASMKLCYLYAGHTVFRCKIMATSNHLIYIQYGGSKFGLT